MAPQGLGLRARSSARGGVRGLAAPASHRVSGRFGALTGAEVSQRLRAVSLTIHAQAQAQA
jgi:hypothetical protein